MIEIPEAIVLANQLEHQLRGKRIVGVAAGVTPHKYAWFYGERDSYPELVCEATISGAISRGGFVEIDAGMARILFSEGMSIRFHEAGDAPAAKHQLLLRFGDGSALSAAAQMYGGVGIVPAGPHGAATLDNPYYASSLSKPSPLSSAFDERYFFSLLEGELGTLSAKAFLATEQRIPGLGNGVLQDILFEAGVHPRFQVREFGGPNDARAKRLLAALKSTLAQMAAAGGRDTERDIYGAQGGYETRMSRFSVGTPCPACGEPIQKQSYMGGSVYFCSQCQPPDGLR